MMKAEAWVESVSAESHQEAARQLIRTDRQPWLTQAPRQCRLTVVAEQFEVPDPSEPGKAFAAVVALRRLADRLELAAAATAVANGWSWADIADALGVSRQAAHKKLAHRIKKGTQR